MSGIGDEFQRQTKYDPDNMPAGPIDWVAQPPLYKQYPDSPKLELPHFEPPKPMSLHECLKKRKSIRRFGRQSLSLPQLSWLLWASTGIQRKQAGYQFRTAPSAGALYPIETYLAANNIEQLDQGLYHYSIENHCLEQLARGDYSRQIAAAALGQAVCASAAVVFLWSAIFQRSKFKYRQRAYRYIYLDAGHIAQNLALAAVSLDLGSCQIGALYDDKLNAVFHLDGAAESVIYLSAVGHPRRTNNSATIP